MICLKRSISHKRNIKFLNQNINNNNDIIKRNFNLLKCNNNEVQVNNWFPPSEEDGKHFTTPIKLYNSLSKSKVPFLITNKQLLKSESNSLQSPPTIYWYSCGPTVYDDTHVGHARNYVSLDIIHRILLYYFNYPVQYVMNITNVDDKILKKSKETNIPPIELANKYEFEFIEDMKRLGIIQPTLYTRVTEHIDEIIKVISTIEDNGFTYVTKGGVYFDSKKFEDSDHISSKLSTNNNTNNETQSQQQEHVEYKDEKKDPRDFVLWKFIEKDKEPLGWESKWGYGRPGWHIECSAMIDSVFRKESKDNISKATIDIHSGGIDLAFPHHNNEIIQSEACHHLEYQSCQKNNWCNYFLHVGHLHIQGLKMSKSLKNFITVREFLKKYTPDQFRIFCLLHKYNQTVEYNEQTMEIAVRYERRLKEFLHNVEYFKKESSSSINRKWNKELTNLHDRFLEKQEKIHNAICNDFDTPSILSYISEMINEVNNIFFTNNKNNDILAIELLDKITGYLTYLFNLFGCRLDEYLSNKNSNGNTEDIETIVNHPFTNKLLEILTEFRSDIRKECLKSEQNPTQILQLIDKLRDEKLKSIGIRIDDRGEKSTFKYDPLVVQEMENEIKEKNENLRKLEQKQNELNFKLTITPENYFKQIPIHAEKQYFKYDEEGVPTHDKEGNELSKSAIKKLKKELEKHKEFLEKHSK